MASDDPTSPELDSRSVDPPSPRRHWLTWGLAATLVVLLALAVILAVSAIGRRGASSVVEAPPATTTVAVAGLVIEPEDGRAPILEEIAAAQHSIALMVYLLSDEEIITALEQAVARGVTVRVILEEHPFGGAGGQPEIFARLERAGIAVRWGNPVFRFTHIKTLIVDDRVALIMNLNLTNSAFTGNRELAVITTRPDDVAQAATIFAADWERSDAATPGPLIVSPTTSRADLLALIERAQATLDVYAEVVRDEEMLAALVAAVERGVRVRLVMSGAAGDDQAEERAALAAAGVDLRLLNRRYIHAKMFLVDDRELFVGSQNMTATSLDQNRELGVIVTDAGSIERAGTVFAGDFAAGRPEAP